MEAARLLVLAVLPVVIDLLVNQEPTALTLILLAVLRAVDKYLHKTGKENGNDALVTGLTRF